MDVDKIEVENVNTPGKVTRVDRAKYEAMRSAYLDALPEGEPGITAEEAKNRLKPTLPQDLFPGGATSGWWLKCVQLDLEAKGIVRRAKTRPLTFFRAGNS